ncbi:MAG TPA: hypothetical protein VEZ47_12330, partial [Gemmatirosa sp.]|nr:hypothetical protein [Gemmatirosa sp.]
MVERETGTEVSVAAEPPPAPPTQAAPPAAPAPRRASASRGEPRDAAAELAARAQQISHDAGSRMTGAMRDLIHAASGLSGFVVETARDVVQFMVRRGQMAADEAEVLMRDAEEAYRQRVAAGRVPTPPPPPRLSAPPAVPAPPAGRTVERAVVPTQPALADAAPGTEPRPSRPARASSSGAVPESPPPAPASPATRGT